MLVVKHMRADGSVSVIGCDSFHRSRIDTARFVTVSAGKTQTHEIGVGDQVFVENMAGKTVDLIRPGHSGH